MQGSALLARQQPPFIQAPKPRFKCASKLGLRLAAVGSAFGKPPAEVLGLITLRLELSETVAEKLFIRLSDSIKQHLLTQEFRLRSFPPLPPRPKVDVRAVGQEKLTTPIHFNFGSWGEGEQTSLKVLVTKCCLI